MRAAPALLALTLAALAVAPPVEASYANYQADYQANVLDWFGPIRVFSMGGGGANVGGVVFPSHQHATTANVGVIDDLNGPIDALICQDMNNDMDCDAFPGSADVYRCLTNGSYAGFPVAAGSTPTDKKVFVIISSYIWHVEGCGPAGEATTGTIGLTYL